MMPNILFRSENLIEHLSFLLERREHILQLIKCDGFHIVTTYKQRCFSSTLTIMAYRLGSGELLPVSLLQAQDNARDTYSFHIQDIETLENNKGYGSYVIKALQYYCSGKYVAKITGALSWVDTGNPEHKARLLHFYKKHGFVVVDDTNERWIQIAHETNSSRTT